MRTLAVLNQKGGVGKTTTVANLGVALARRGRSVLLIDLDPQAHLSLHLGLELAQDEPGIYSLLIGRHDLRNTLRPIEANLQLIPAHTDLAAAQVELVDAIGRETILREALATLTPPADIVLIDCPPSLGLLTLNALAAADEVLIPMQAHFLALQGVGKLLETVQLVQQRLNPQLRVGGILLCMFEAGTKLSTEVLTDLRQFFESQRQLTTPWSAARIYKSTIRRNIKLAESPSYGRTVFDYAAKSHGALDYAELADELLALQNTIGADSALRVHTAATPAIPDTTVARLANTA
ncbi:MAG: Sporulation initiation inhibitor protein Soj [Phycisphaerae bacterium]|nr:Sporulation initiation inhibitor protein Soj [Phycisphaerae bacterium]